MQKATLMVVYAQRDGYDTPESLITHLRDQGYDVWSDKDVILRADWSEELVRQINQRALMIALIGRAAPESRCLQRKIDIARGVRMSILPVVHVGQYDFQNDPLFIADFQPLDYKGQNWNTFPHPGQSIDRLAESTRLCRQIAGTSRKEPMLNSTFGAPISEKRFECDIFMIMPFANT